MKKLSATTNIINKTTKWLLEKPTCVGTDKGKMVTRWDEKFEFECESDDAVFTTENILEAVEWLYVDENKKEGGITEETKNILSHLKTIIHIRSKAAENEFYEKMSEGEELEGSFVRGMSCAFDTMEEMINSLIQQKETTKGKQINTEGYDL